MTKAILKEKPKSKLYRKKSMPYISEINKTIKESTELERESGNLLGLLRWTGGTADYLEMLLSDNYGMVKEEIVSLSVTWLNLARQVVSPFQKDIESIYKLIIKDQSESTLLTIVIDLKRISLNIEELRNSKIVCTK